MNAAKRPAICAARSKKPSAKKSAARRPAQTQPLAPYTQLRIMIPVELDPGASDGRTEHGQRERRRTGRRHRIPRRRTVQPADHRQQRADTVRDRTLRTVRRRRRRHTRYARGLASLPADHDAGSERDARRRRRRAGRSSSPPRPRSHGTSASNSRPACSATRRRSRNAPMWTSRASAQTTSTRVPRTARSGSRWSR